MDLGTSLKDAREQSGLTLSELAGRTRIPIKFLRAIEQNDFARVPPGIFVRSFIRTFAREVGLDPDEAVAAYLSATTPVVEPEVDSPPREEIDEEVGTRFSALNLAESRPGWGYALMVAALIVAIVSINRDETGVPDAIETPAAPAAAADTPARPMEPDVRSAVATTGTALGIELHAEGLCWVRVIADGELRLERLMQPGETETVTAQREISMRVGDPAALSYFINGQPGPVLGAPEVPVTVRVDQNGHVTRAS